MIQRGAQQAANQEQQRLTGINQLADNLRGNHHGQRHDEHDALVDVQAAGCRCRARTGCRNLTHGAHAPLENLFD